MALTEYQVGGQETKVDANEALKEIQDNKTLLIAQLTDEEPLLPENVYGLKKIDDVFKHFQPNVHVEMEDAEGMLTVENLKFAHLGDFKPDHIVNQSKLLNNLKIRQEQFTKINRQLKGNKMLQYLLGDPERKEALLDALRIMAADLQNIQQ